jgi:hypothetical protein
MAEGLIGLYVGGILGGGLFGLMHDAHKGRPFLVNMSILAVWPILFVAYSAYILLGVEQ